MAETSTGRACASAALVAGLLVLVTVALRGYVPGRPPATPDRTPDDPVAAVVVIGLLAASVAVVVVAVVLRLRRPEPAAARVAGRLDWVRGDHGGPTRRTWAIAFGVIVFLVLIVAMLSRLTLDAAPDATAPDASSNAPGTQAESPPPPRDDTPTPAVVERDWNLLGYFYVATAVFLVVIVAGSVAQARRRPQANAPEVGEDDHTDLVDAHSDTLARAAEVGLAAVGDLTLDPRTSIIACYAAMERELALVPGASPRDFDTASEVLARAVDMNALRPDSATELVDLFDEARFSPHVMTEGHREAAVAVLRRVLAELGSGA